MFHPTQLEHINAQGKDKGLVSYNNNRDTNVLKIMFIMNIQIYNKWEVFPCKGLQKSKVKNKLQKRGKLSPFFKS